ncbi:hypothetical protein AAMO2058_001113100 [Amorphochlora amoebiformis]
MGAMAARIRGERRRKEAPDTMISKIYAFIQHTHTLLTALIPQFINLLLLPRLKPPHFHSLPPPPSLQKTDTTPPPPRGDPRCVPLPLANPRRNVNRGRSVNSRLGERYTLVLDLDETLVHTARLKGSGAHCRLEIMSNRNCRRFFVFKRPYLDEFLEEMSCYFEIVIFTASVKQYADPLIDILDSRGVIARRYFRDACIDRDGSFVKDLSKVSPTNLERTIIIDNTPAAYSLNKENAIPMKPFYDDPNDRELLSCMPFLMALRTVDDVRTILGRREGF